MADELPELNFDETSDANYGKGNIDLNNRPVIKNPDGSISTVNSMTFEDNGKYVLVPGVNEERQLSPREAFEQYKKTGNHLGRFDTQEEADEYAQNLHEQQSKQYVTQGGSALPELDFGEQKITAKPTPKTAQTSDTILGIPTDPMWGYNFMKSTSMGSGEAIMNLGNQLAKLVGGHQPGSAPEFQAKNAPIPGVATGARELAPMMIPMLGQEALGARLTGLAAKYLPKGAGIVGRAAARMPYGAGFGAVSAATEEDATPEDIKHSAAIMAGLNAVTGGLFDMIPGSQASVIKMSQKAAEKDKSITGGMRTPEQAKEAMEDIGKDILSFPDLVRAPKLQSFYHKFLKVMPYSGIPKAQEEAMTRLEKDAGDVYGSILGNANEGDDVLARSSLGDDIHNYVNKLKDEAINPILGTGKYEILEKEAEKVYKEIGGNVDKLDEVMARADITKNIQEHVESEVNKVSPLFENIKNEKINFQTENTKNYAKNLLEEHKESIKAKLGGTLSPTIRTKLSSLASKEKTSIESALDNIPEEIPENIRKQLAYKYEKVMPREPKERMANLGAIRTSISKYNDVASELATNGNLADTRIYSEIANNIEKDLEKSLEEGGNSQLFNEYKNASKEYKERIVPFKHPEKVGLKKLIDNRINLNSNELEKILSDTTNQEAIDKLSPEIKNNIFTRILNSKMNDKIVSQSERISDAYSKMSSNEKALADNETRKKIYNLYSKSNKLNLEPVIKEDDLFKKESIPILEKVGIIKDKNKFNQLSKFVHSEDNNMVNLIKNKDSIDYNSNAMENIIKNSKNKDALKQLPQEIQNKMFSRLTQQNIGKTEEALNTRAEKITAAYKKMGDYEKSFISPEAKSNFDNIAKRTEQLKPVLEKAGKAWKTFYKAKSLAYMAGIPLYSSLGGTALIPLALAAGVGTPIAKFLGSKTLMKAYTGQGEVFGKGAPKIGTELAKYLQLKINKKQEGAKK